tara:strand:- start:298 stop:525 length:228 start_codon:yes stop_codon:yes gene_type:complete
MAEQSNQTKLAVIANDINHIKDAIEAINKKLGSLDEVFATQKELNNLKKKVDKIYYLGGIIILAFVGALIKLVFK